MTETEPPDDSWEIMEPLEAVTLEELLAERIFTINIYGEICHAGY